MEVNITEECVVTPPPGMEKWRFYRVEFGDAHNPVAVSYVWVPPHKPRSEVRTFFERPYHGPIEPGMWFVWEPGVRHAECVVVVTKLSYHNGDSLIYTKDPHGETYWNDESRFREAVVLYERTEGE